MRPPFASIAALAPFSLILAIAEPAHALDAEVTSDTAAQTYDVRSPTGETVLERRRLTSTLGVGVYNLIDAQTDATASQRQMAPELIFRARLRYDADYGANAATVDPTNASAFVPGYSNGMVDLMYGYLEGRRFAGGWLGFKVGRQYITDSLGWWSFDGGLVRATTPFFFAVEAYGGLEQRGGMLLSSSRYEADGIWRGNRSNMDPSLYTSFQKADIAPAYGVALESVGPTWIHGRLTYRRVYDTGSSNTSQFASGLYAPVSYDGMRISQERVGYTADANFSDIGGAKAGFAYDLYNEKFSSVYASLDGYLGQKATVSLDYDFYAPTYDGDSIWNFFPSEPMNDFGARGVINFTDRLSVSGGGHARMFSVQTASYSTISSPNITSAGAANYFPSNGQAFDGGGNIQARYKWGEGVVGLRGSGNFGKDGDRAGAEVSGQRTFDTRYIVSGRVSTWQWDDKLRPDRSATNFGYVAGLGYRFAQRSQTMFEFQHDMNRLVGQRFRALITLTVAAAK